MPEKQIYASAKDSLWRLCLFCGCFFLVWIISENLWSWLSFFSIIFYCIHLHFFVEDCLNLSCGSSKKIPRYANKAVVITGCDSGFGFNLAKKLDSMGFHVFAGCLFASKGGALELQQTGSSKLHVLQLNVQKSEDVEKAKLFFEENSKDIELWAVVNNAGISKGTQTELTQMDQFEEVLDVNLMGVIRVTKVFLPLLRKSKGRVINVASAAGRFPWPSFVAYGVSKSALISFSDILRLEMHDFGISVVSIEPWMYSTKLADTMTINKLRKKEWLTTSIDVKSFYNTNYMERVERRSQNLFQFFLNTNIEEVTSDMVSAIVEEVPMCYYRPGKWYLNVFFGFINKMNHPFRHLILCWMLA